MYEVSWSFHLCFLMNNRDFSMKQTMKITKVISSLPFVIFTVCKNSGLKCLPKGLRCSILSKITARMLTFRDRTTDVTNCADVTLFLHATSGGLSQNVAFSLPRFLAFNCFKRCLASFSRYKTAFLPNIMPPKHGEQDQIDAKWLGKKLVFWR